MDIMITTTIFLSVLQAALCFNIDPVAWRSLENDAAGFGYRVVQRSSEVLVSAPLAQYSPTGRGKIFSCSPRWDSTCRELPIQPPVFAVNMSLGLTMANDPSSSNTLVCGPTVPKDCQSITMYNGVCMEISNIKQLTAPPPIPSSPEECRSQADIAFLLDGSGSVDREDFERMKSFVMAMVKSFIGKDTKFAIAQFATDTTIHYYFDTFDVNNMQAQMRTITQLRGWTYTAGAIRTVVNNIFSGRGSRDKVRKVLIVITDGQSNDREYLKSSVDLAQRKSIVRFAIGVGNAFINDDARQELRTIASSPPENHVYQVGSFEALENIRKALQDKIFSIEGSTTGGGSLEMEMAQEGFSAAYVPGAGFQMGMVGANNWKGGYQTYANNIKSGSYEPDYIEPDSYLGYSMAVALTRQGSLTVVGAPRYQHRGIVMAVQTNGRYKKIDPFPWQFQSGEYFGAEVCAMDVDRDAYTDLIVISAPMYMDDDREGRVYACILTKLDVDCQFGDSPVILRGIESHNGRFGSSLAVLPDLNSDGLNDLAVGAPLENDNQGSIYIFHGELRGRFSLAYSQRIAGSEVAPGLKFFGISISQSSFDQSGDHLTDLAVGSKGKVVLLRSKPIVMVEAKVSFTPGQISTLNSDCTKPLNSIAKICFTMTRDSIVDTARARINCTLTLDATRKIPNNRAYFSEKQRVGTRSVDISLGRVECFSMNFFIDPCPEDALNPLNNELQFIFEGLPSDENLRPSLAERAQTTTFHPLGFEINCGADEKCVDNLKVDFNFTSSSEVKVGIDELLEVTVSVENRGENAYNSRVILTYPAGLSYRKFRILQGRIECNSLDSEDDRSRGKTDCSVNKPIFKSDAKVLFIVSYGVEAISEVDKRIYVTANATSGNQEHSPASDLYKKKFIDVKYSIFVTIDSSLSYNNFTFGKNDLQKPVDQSIKVTNDIRALNFTVVIKVPIKLGDKDIWVDSRSLQIPDCQRDRDEEPGIKDFVPQIQKNNLVDCSVAHCSVFKCKRFMEKLDSKQYKISANLSSRWIEQIGLKSAKYLLTSTASLEYDRNQYIFFSLRTNNNPPVRKIEAEVEVYPEPDFTKEIVGGSLGGLALLALLTAGLYKAGFFKSKYKEMMDTGGEAGDADGGEPPQE